MVFGENTTESGWISSFNTDIRPGTSPCLMAKGWQVGNATELQLAGH
jgi:hypothetical protein